MILPMVLLQKEVLQVLSNLTQREAIVFCQMKQESDDVSRRILNQIKSQKRHGRSACHVDYIPYYLLAIK